MPPPIIVVTPDMSASSICCGQMKWMCGRSRPPVDDQALARDDLGARADDHPGAGLDIGVAGLADPGDAAVFDADVGLDDARAVEDQRVGDDGIDRLGHPELAWPMPSRITLPPPNLTSSP